MPARRQHRTKKKAAPAFMVLLSKRPGAPKACSRALLQRLFAQAWALTPAVRRPRLKGARAAAVDALLVDDSEIAELNARHLRHRGPTDVLSFPIGDVDPVRRAYFLGEIVVSFETAEREAAERGLPTSEEWARYLVHGFLHLLGYDDRTPKLRAQMEALQERILLEARIRRC